MSDRCDTRQRGSSVLALAVLGCVALAACGSTGAPSGTVTNGANPSAEGPDFPLQFARCMRSHGVPSFPDPSSRGGIDIAPGSGINPQSPAFQSAKAACRRYLPKGIGHPPPMTAAQYRAALAFAQCMRRNGEPNFPDPSRNPSGTGPVLSLDGMLFKPGPGLDPQSPAFRQAVSRCGVRPPPA